jgi:large subunit ribosomal protein L25
VSCLPGNLPEHIDLDLADLKPGDIVHLSQIKLPKGVTLPALNLGADHDIAVVTANAVKEEAEPAAEAAPAAEAKPADKK